jgi:cytochrome c551/c552
MPTQSLPPLGRRSNAESPLGGRSSAARKYRSLKGQTHAQIKNQLRNKIKNGGTGVWGQIPMPPQPDVSKRDLDLILDYILMLE